MHRISPFSLLVSAALDGGKLACYLNMSWFSFYAPDRNLANALVYPTLMRVISNFQRMATSVLKLFNYYNVFSLSYMTFYNLHYSNRSSSYHYIPQWFSGFYSWLWRVWREFEPASWGWLNWWLKLLLVVGSCTTDRNMWSIEEQFHCWNNGCTADSTRHCATSSLSELFWCLNPTTLLHFSLNPYSLIDNDKITISIEYF